MLVWEIIYDPISSRTRYLVLITAKGNVVPLYAVVELGVREDVALIF
jgi:hypothetical protein